MGGIEGADHVNGAGVPLDLTAANGHHLHFEADYAAAAGLGLRTLRESIGWRLGEPSTGRHALERTVEMARAAQRQGVQLLWTLMHYGTPPDLSLLDDRFIARFASFAAQVARALAPLHDHAPVYTPINEIGFLAWAVSQTRLMAPYAPMPCGDLAGAALQAAREGSWRVGYEAKLRLVRAALTAMAAMRRADPRCRFLHVEPVVHVVAPVGRPDLEPLAREIAAHQWQTFDLLAGRCEPSLGGSEASLDLIGVNHYHTGQWETGSETPLCWATRDPRRRPFAEMLAEVARRYARPVLVSETSHVGDGRAEWLVYVAEQLAAAQRQGVPVAGLCLYPLVDRPDWSDLRLWHRSGLFDVTPPAPAEGGQRGSPAPERPPPWQRALQPAYAAALRRCQQLLPIPLEPEDCSMPTLIVFCHLRWGFVYQRPQQLLSRLARDHRVLFIEEPLPPGGADDTPRLAVSRPTPGVEVLTPHTGVAAAGFHDDQLPVLLPLLADYLADEGIADAAVWFYTPMALPLLAAVSATKVIYDCMDELAAFKGAPRQLRQREAALMKTADIVLTGGPSLYEARRALHPNVHCLPSAVDASHFSPERLLPESDEAVACDALHAGIAGPRLGFYGVIDERLDTALLAELADARPDWQWLMAGPVVKIDLASLPRRPNLHWLGMQPYAVLPYLLAAWDVSLLPFALNDSTRFISPTKTLEYMAARKPIVSTAVHDVALLYGDVVRIAHDAAGFIGQCEAALREQPAARAAQHALMAATVWRMSWDRTAGAVHALLVQAAAGQREPQDLPLEARFGT